MKVVQIASGSKGNATFFEADGYQIMIDVGISKKRILECLSHNKIELNNLKAIFLTHEHTDHTSGLIPLFNHTKALIYTTKGTYLGLSSKIREKIDESYFRFIDRTTPIQIGSLVIEPVEIYHDANDPLGFVIKKNDTKVVYITDTGYVKQTFFDKLSNADLYIWESNHDPEVLMQSDRPYETKMRILSDVGHLSNQDSAYVLANLIGPKTKQVIFAHISEECNLVQIVKVTSSRVFKELGVDTSKIRFDFASQIPMEVINL